MTEASADRGTLFESGDELIDRIRHAIVARRPVLITGPRGSGKTHCAREAIRLAKKAKEIGGSRFLQGNREIPREYLSEDMLVVREDDNGKPTLALIDALVIRHPSLSPGELHQRRGDHEVWPAVPPGKETGWASTDWTALFLDEINRFGDGFLDSLLSLTEERTIVRSGDELHVPLTVVATANPPGYDVTAKKLSPPLQSRMARSYRVAQPSLEALSCNILPGLLQRHNANIENAPKAGPDTIQVASGIGLCLWGIPSADRKGTGFLTNATIALLEEAIRISVPLHDAMTRLSELVAFGPDARSIGDWLAAASGAARGTSDVILDSHLEDTALEALGHKLRETFNEGVEPAKAVRLAELVGLITHTVLEDRQLRNLFAPPYAEAAQTLFGASPPLDATYLFARRFAGLRGSVDDLAKQQQPSGPAALRALYGLRADLQRRAANASDKATANTMHALATTVTTHVKRIECESLDVAAFASTLRTLTKLPDHVTARIERTLPDKAQISAANAVTTLAFIGWALQSTVGPAANPRLAVLSPALADALRWITAGKQQGAISEEEWKRLATRFQTDVVALQTVATVLLRELAHPGASRFQAALKQRALPPQGS